MLLQPLFRNDVDSSPESIAVADRADKIDEQPVIRSSGFIAQLNHDIDGSIVIQVSEGCASCRQRHPEYRTAFSRYVAELPRIVFHEKERFAVTHPCESQHKRCGDQLEMALFFPRRHRSSLAQLRVFFCQYRVSQSCVDLSKQHIKLKINDDPPRITNIGRPLRVFSRLLIVLES